MWRRGAWLLWLGVLVGCRGATPAVGELHLAREVDAPHGRARPARDASAASAPQALAVPSDAGPDAQAERDMRCTRDADCVLTSVPPESCCPTLCAPRALSTEAAARLEKACAGFSQDTCAAPMCRPQPGAPTAACEAGVCTVRRVSTN